MDQNEVWRFDGTTGVFLGVFSVSPPNTFSGVLGIKVHGGSVFATYGGLNLGSLLRYDLAIGEASVVYSQFSFNGPRSPVFDGDGNMYVPDWQTPNVRKFDAPDYTTSSNFIVDSTLSPIKLQLGPKGELLVLSEQVRSNVRRYDRHTGAFLGTLIGDIPASSILVYAAPVAAPAVAAPAAPAAYLALLGFSLLALGCGITLVSRPQGSL